MTTGLFDKADISIPCPSCGKVNKKAIGWLKTHKQIKCAKCGDTFDLDTSQFNRELRKVDQATAKFKKTFKIK